MQDPVAGLVSFVIMLYIALLFVRQFASESERYDAVLGLIFRATDPVVAPVQNALPAGSGHLAPALVLAALLLIQGLLIGSIPYAVKQFAGKLLQLYVLIIIIISAIREFYTNPIASFCQRIVNPVRLLAAGVSQHVPTVNLVSVVGLAAVHTMVAVVLNGLLVSEFDNPSPLMDALIGSGPGAGQPAADPQSHAVLHLRHHRQRAAVVGQSGPAQPHRAIAHPHRHADHGADPARRPSPRRRHRHFPHHRHHRPAVLLRHRFQSADRLAPLPSDLSPTDPYGPCQRGTRGYQMVWR